MVRYITRTDSPVDGGVDEEVDAEARSISAAEQGADNSTSRFKARQDRTTTAARQGGRNPMGGFYSLRK
jgi:hypothetical protein